MIMITGVIYFTPIFLTVLRSLPEKYYIYLLEKLTHKWWFAFKPLEIKLSTYLTWQLPTLNEYFDGESQQLSVLDRKNTQSALLCTKIVYILKNSNVNRDTFQLK